MLRQASQSIANLRSKARVDVVVVSPWRRQPPLPPLASWPACCMLVSRGVADRVAGVSPAITFQRIHDAPTMAPDKLVRTLRELVAEKSNDVLLFQALSRRFLANAEEYFPPQIDAVLDAFATLSYADHFLIKGLVGRLGDLMSDASPRRVVRVLRNGAALQLPSDEWLHVVIPQLERHLPNLREGIPSVLASLHTLRHSDEEMIELLLTQGLIVSDSLSDGFSARLLERWSRHGFHHAEAETLASRLATVELKGPGLNDVRDSLNLMTAINRCAPKLAKTSRELEAQLETRLRDKEDSSEAMLALSWMQRLHLRSESLWRVCADSVELGLKHPNFVRDQLPTAVHALASLLGNDMDQEVSLLASLLGATETRNMLPRYQAPDLLSLLRAVCLAATRCESGGTLEAQLVATPGISWSTLVESTVRLAPQLPLQERRSLRSVVEVLLDLDRRHGCLTRPEGSVSATKHLVEICREMPLSPLPLVCTSGGLVPIDVGVELLLQSPNADSTNKGEQRQAVKFLGHGDVFAGVSLKSKSPELTPRCLLTVRALTLQGWEVELRAG